MTKIITSVPERYVDGFISLFELSNEDFQKLNKSINKAPICNGIGPLAKSISKSSKIEQKKIEEILSSVNSLFFLKEQGEIKNVVESLADAILQSIEKKKTKSSIDNFKNRLIKLLDIEQLYFLSKTYELYSEHHNLFLSSKILTDIRPIFTDANLEPKATLITNVLHIHYGQSDGKHEDIYIALDDKDIQNLKTMVERAEQKNKTLKRLIKEDGMKLIVLDPTKEN